MLAFEPTFGIRLGRRCEILPCLLACTIKVWYDNCNYPLDSRSQDNVFVYNDDINKPYYLFTFYIPVYNFKFIFIHIYTSGVRGGGRGVGGLL